MRLVPVLAATAACSLSVTALGPTRAQAQESAQSTEPIDEILVTARKRQESLQEVPVAVTAFTAETLSERQIRSVEDIARFTPGFVFSKAFGRAVERPVIRGQSSILAGTNPSAEAGAAYFVDGVYYPGDIQGLDLQDLERIEVIKGPQSALYGRNTYSGAVNFITRGPPQEFGARVAGHFDEDEYEANLTLGGHFTETLGASLTLRKMEFDGQWTNGVNGETIGGEATDSVSAVLDFKPSADVSLRLRAGYSEDRDGTRPLFLQSAAFNNCMPGTRSLASYPASGSTNNNQYFCGDVGAQPIFLNTSPRTNDLVTLPGVPANVTVLGATAYNAGQGVAFSGVERDLAIVSFIGNWDIAGSGYTMNLSSAWRDEERRTGSDSDHSAVNLITAPGGICFLCASDLDEYEDYSVELRFASPVDERMRWTLGAFHYEQDQESRTIGFTTPDGIPDVVTPCPAGPNAGRICSGSPYRFLDVYTDAFFGSLEFDINAQWTINAELRYEEDTKAFADLAPTTPASPISYDKETFDHVTPRLTLRYRPSDTVNLYGIYSEGVKPGGSNGRTGQQAGSPQFQQEESKNYELGAKTEWLERRLTANVALYFTDVTNQQLTTPVAIGAGGATSTLTSIVTNQGSGEVLGAELELRFVATDNLTLGFNYARTDSEYTEGCDGDQFLLTSGGGQFNANFPADQQPNNFNGEGDCSIVGKQFPLTSKDTASVTADLRFPLANDGWNVYVNADASYESEKPVQVHNLAFIPEATVVGLRAGLQTDNWTAGLYARNLFDEDAPVAVTRWLQVPYFLPPGGTTQPNVPPAGPLIPGASYTLPRSFFGTLRRERQVGVEFTYRFGGIE